LPEHHESLDEVFGDSQPRIGGRSGGTIYSYDDLKRIFDLQNTFFRGAPFSGEERGMDMVYSGWFYRFDGNGDDSIGIKFDPWFKDMGCDILHALWAHFGRRFPEDVGLRHSTSRDSALESRISAYIGIEANGQDDFVPTAWNLLSQDFDLHVVSAGYRRGHYGVIGTRKEPHLKDILPGTTPMLNSG